MNFLQKMKLNSLTKRVKALYTKRERGGNVDAKHEIDAQLELARFYDQHRFDKKLPKAEIYAAECYRAAAILGSPQAQYIFGQRRLEEGKFWDHWSKGMYGRDIHKTYANAAYEEALNYLIKAETNGHAHAKRLHGLAYIQGWGLPKDQDKGAKLVVDSIDDEKAWDRAPEIFQKLGLNNPEFYSSIMSARSAKAN